MNINFCGFDIREYDLNNGMKIVVIPDTTQEGLIIALQIPTGKFSDPVGYEGCAELCSELMQKGTKSLEAEKFLSKFESKGAMLFSNTEEEHSVFGIKMLSKFKEELFPYFWEMIISPRLEGKELKRLQKEASTALKAETVEPKIIANRFFFRKLASVNHPAGRHSTISSINKIKKETIEEFYKKNIHPLGSVLIFAGNIKEGKFLEDCISSVEKWKGHIVTPLRSEVPMVESNKPVVVFVEKNDLTQASLIIGQATVGEMHQDFLPLSLANYILGGGNFSSRLMQRIRSDAGKTYGVSSHLTATKNFGAIAISTSTQNFQLKEVVSTITDEYKRFCLEGVKDDEIENAKKFAIGNMAFQLEGMIKIVEKILWLKFYKKPYDFIEKYFEMVLSSNSNSINSAIKKWLNPERLIIVAVGKKSEVLPQLTTFGEVECFHYKDIELQ
ncbi:MAG: insulinase family protein [Chitinispirillaceae bacterium]|nr:insulinase family protein [Chitinispirillaceae bacterium]